MGAGAQPRAATFAGIPYEAAERDAQWRVACAPPGDSIRAGGGDAA